MSNTEQSWQQTLQVWIGRFREAQAKVRELQDELDKVTATGDALLRRYEDALLRLPDEALAEHYAAVRKASVPVQEVTSGGPVDVDTCGCS